MTHPLRRYNALYILSCLALLVSGCLVTGDGAPIEAGVNNCGPSTAGGMPASDCNCDTAQVPEVGEPLPGVDITSIPKKGGTFRTLVYLNMPSLMPLMHSDAWIFYMTIHHVYEALVIQDPRTYEYRSELAESWERNESGTEWTFHLRKGVKWHDGEDFDAEDVIFTFDTIMNSNNRTHHMRSRFQDAFETTDPYVAIDEYTVKIRLKRPVFTFLQELNETVIIPKHVFSRGDFNTHNNLRAPIGTGPFQFVEWNDKEIIFKRNENYWGRPAYLDRLVFPVITDLETAFLMLKRGDIDYISRLQPHQRSEGVTEKVLEDFNLTDYSISAYAYWVYNTQKPYFESAKTRQAMTMLIPRERIICEIYQCGGSMVTGPFPKTHPAYDQNLEPYPYDPDAAMKLLEEDGWIDTDGDGIREKEFNGERLPFRFTFLLSASSRTMEQQLTIVQSIARRAGIEVLINKVDWSVYVDRLRKHEYEAAGLRWILSHENDPYDLFHSEGASNYSQLRNDELDEVLEFARFELDSTIRNTLFSRVHQIIYEQQPYSFIFNPVLPGLVSKKFSGLYTSDSFAQWREIWSNDPSLPDVPVEERHPGQTGGLPYEN